MNYSEGCGEVLIIGSISTSTSKFISHIMYCHNVTQLQNEKKSFTIKHIFVHFFKGKIYIANNRTIFHLQGITFPLKFCVSHFSMYTLSQVPLFYNRKVYEHSQEIQKKLTPSLYHSCKLLQCQAIRRNTLSCTAYPK